MCELRVLTAISRAVWPMGSLWEICACLAQECWICCCACADFHRLEVRGICDDEDLEGCGACAGQLLFRGPEHGASGRAVGDADGDASRRSVLVRWAMCVSRRWHGCVLLLPEPVPVIVSYDVPQFGLMDALTELKKASLAAGGIWRRGI